MRGRGMRRRRVARRGCALLLLTALLPAGGCGAGARSARRSPLGRPIAAGAPAVGQAPAPVGDPVPERGGTVPAGLAGGEDAPAAGAISSSPEAALRRYALAYTNWQAAGVVAHEHQLAALAVGPARLAALQTAASLRGGGGLVAHQVQNTGAVLAIAPGQGAARGRWVVVTQEQTTGTGAYAGLPSSLHVTLARVVPAGGGWVVWGWWPGSRNARWLLARVDARGTVIPRRKAPCLWPHGGREPILLRRTT
jgi:hypothetical protein